jgi:DoxX
MYELRSLLRPGWNARSIIFIRLAVGLIFFTQGILKYIDPHMGALRFMRIGFPMPEFTAHFVGIFEIVCGFLVLLGLVARTAHPASQHSTADRNSDRDCDDQDSGIVPSQPGFLVHGERREDGLCDDDESAFPDQRRRRRVVSRRVDMETAFWLSLNRPSTTRAAIDS